MSEWIPVTERLPEVETNVLLRVTFQTHEFCEITIGHLHQPRDFRYKPYFNWVGMETLCHPKINDFHRVEYICPGSEFVTHWMPLPEPPKEAQQNA